MSAKLLSVQRTRAQARARVVTSVSRTTEGPPYWLGNSSGPLAMTDLIFNLTWVCSMSHKWLSAKGAHARARAVAYELSTPEGPLCLLGN
eukprot:7762965-Pyramimonas_sp.AAC.1